MSEAGLELTMMTARPGWTPRCASAAVRALQSSRISAATPRPSMILADGREVTGLTAELGGIARRLSALPRVGATVAQRFSVTSRWAGAWAADISRF